MQLTRSLFFILISFIIGAGCASLSTKINQINSYQSINETKAALGKPFKREAITSEVVRLTYKDFDWGTLSDKYYWLYFQNNQLIRKTAVSGVFDDLDDYLTLNLITREQYEYEVNERSKNALVALQAFSNYKNQQNKNQENTFQGRQIYENEHESATYDISCSSDFSCGYGNKCVKRPGHTNGVCMKSVDEYGISTFTSPNLNSVNPNFDDKTQCDYNLDCPMGFRCDKTYKVCVK